MSRASWKGILKLSLVTCPVYLTPATTRTKSIRLNQVWVHRPVGDLDRVVDGREEQSQGKGRASEEAPNKSEAAEVPRTPKPRIRAMSGPEASEIAEEMDDRELLPRPEPARRVALRPHDPETGEEIERDDVVKGFEYARGRFVTFSKEELRALDVESSHTIDLTTFVPRAEIDPIYFNVPYYLYPDGPIALEPLRVISAAMAETGMAGLGRLTLNRRERMVVVEPRGTGMVLITLRAADEVRAAEFPQPQGEVDHEMVEIAKTIVLRRAGYFDPTVFRDRYQEALRALIEAKTRGVPVKAAPETEAAPVIDLMAALKCSLAEENTPPGKARRTRSGDRRQRALLLPMSGKATKPEARASARQSRRKVS